MRTVVMSVTAVMILLLAGFAVLGIGGRAVRENELERNTDTALEQTMYNLKVNRTYGYLTGNGVEHWAEELSADFIQNLLMMMDSDSDITVNVLDADPFRGLLDVETRAVYRNIAGGRKEIVCRRTVLFDEWVNENKVYHKIKFLVDKDVVRSVNIHSKNTLESVLDEVGIPEKEGMKFERWMPDIAVEGDLRQHRVTQDLTLTAVFT